MVVLSLKVILQMIFTKVKQLRQQVKITQYKVYHHGLRLVNLRVLIVSVNYKMTNLFKKTKAAVQLFSINDSLIISKVMEG